MSRVIEILIAPAASSVPQVCQKVSAVAGRGLEGDRYFLGTGTFSPHPQKPAYEVTLIEKENIEAFRLASGLPFTSRHARRNLVTEGVDLNALEGREFKVGEVSLRGLKLCEPCKHLANSAFPEVLPGLIHKGGLRAQILSNGTIRVGDPVTVPSPAPSRITHHASRITFLRFTFLRFTLLRITFLRIPRPVFFPNKHSPFAKSLNIIDFSPVSYI